MLEELAALGSVYAEGLDVGRLLADIGYDSDLWDKGVESVAGMAGTLVIFVFMLSTHFLFPLFSKSFDYLDDIERSGALVNAASAAYAGIGTVVICREVDELMHKSLSESLHLARTVVSVSHHSEIGVHTGIPAAISLNTASRLRSVIL